MKISIGSDPEVFVYNRNTGNVVSPHTFSTGDKDKPELIEGLDGYGLQVDGFALEYNTAPVEVDLADPKSRARGPDQFAARSNVMLGEIYGRIGNTKLKGSRYLDLSQKSMVTIPEDIFKDAPEKVKELGCDPDYNAWTGEQNNPPKPEEPIRAAGGHIHVGWTKDQDVTDAAHLELCKSAVRQLDFTLGLMSVIRDVRGMDRRKLYGKAGAFRPKSYGVEYRSLSNFWIFNSGIAGRVASLVFRSMDDLTNGIVYEEIYGDPQHAINNGDSKYAKEFFKAQGLTY